MFDPPASHSSIAIWKRKDKHDQMPLLRDDAREQQSRKDERAAPVFTTYEYFFVLLV